MQVSSLLAHSVGKELLRNSTKPVFYSGTSYEVPSTLRKCVRDGFLLSAIDNLKQVVDTLSRARLMLPNVTLVAIL